MKYTKEQRLDIARRVYDGELTVEEAAVKYEPNPSSVKGYLRLYRAKKGLSTRTRRKKAGNVTSHGLSRIKRNLASKNMKLCRKKNLLSSWHG